MGQTQGKDGDGDNINNNADSISPRKKDKKKKEKSAWKLNLKEKIALQLVKSTISSVFAVENATNKVSSAIDPTNWKKKPKLSHNGHFELLPKVKSRVNVETSLGIFFCLPNELLFYLSTFLSWKEALYLQASSRGLFLMLEEDLYWQELYDKVDWKAPEKDPPPKEITQDESGAPDDDSIKVEPPPVPQYCCAKKRFLKRYLSPEEKSAQAQVKRDAIKKQMDELYARIRKKEKKRDEKKEVVQREAKKQIDAMDHKRWMVALVCCIVIALFMKPVTIFVTKLVIFTCQLPADFSISLVEKSSCWRSFPVACFGFNSRKNFDSLDFAIESGLRDDYLFCLPKITVGCMILFVFWVVFQVGKLISTLLAFGILWKLSLAVVDRIGFYLRPFKPFNPKEINDRLAQQKKEIDEHYNPKVKPMYSRIDELRNKPEMAEPASKAPKLGCCIQ